MMMIISACIKHGHHHIHKIKKLIVEVLDEKFEQSLVPLHPFLGVVITPPFFDLFKDGYDLDVIQNLEGLVEFPIGYERIVILGEHHMDARQLRLVFRIEFLKPVFHGDMQLWLEEIVEDVDGCRINDLLLHLLVHHEPGRIIKPFAEDIAGDLVVSHTLDSF